MDGVPVLFIEEVCRQFSTKDASALEELPFWKDVSRRLFTGRRMVNCGFYCRSDMPDVCVKLWKNDGYLRLEELESLPNAGIEHMCVSLNDSRISGDILTPSYAAQLLKLSSKQRFSIAFKFVSYNPPRTIANFPILTNFLMSLPRIYSIDCDDWSLVEAVAGRAADRGTLRELSMLSLVEDPIAYKNILQTFSRCRTLKLFRYYNLIRPNLELSDEEKAHFRMEKKPKEHVIDFIHI
uniref:FBD domain-containing protein n=1 Tax=Steinernema glaseri TaxID=37863 RepID=A0A1I7Z8L0_9BILA